MGKRAALCAWVGCVATAAAAQSIDADIVQQTNAFRGSQGRPAVTSNATLAATAQAFADFMAQTDRYAHDADGKQPSDRAMEHGYTYCVLSENIAFRYRSPDFASTHELATSLVAGWEHSPVHRRNMLDPDVRDTGVGVAKSARSGRWYGVQMFGLSKDAQIRFQLTNEGATTIRYRLGDRPLDLAPRATRIHAECRPSRIALNLPGHEQPVTIDAHAGERYVIGQDAAGRWNYTRGPQINAR